VTAPARLVCKGAGEDVNHCKRPATRPGPWCVTCRRARKKITKASKWAERLMSRFGMTAEEYRALYEAQGGRCYICRTARGITKMLAVEHRHADGLWRGLACGPCNWLLAKLGDDPAEFRRIADALEHPPAVALFGPRYAPPTKETTP
jgi:recombination endonuclease VII